MNQTSLFANTCAIFSQTFFMIIGKKMPRHKFRGYSRLITIIHKLTVSLIYDILQWKFSLSVASLCKRYKIFSVYFLQFIFLYLYSCG